MDAQEQIERFQEFFQINFFKKLHDIARKGKKSVKLDFSELTRFDHELSEALLEEPDELIRAAELAIDNLDLKNIRTRFFNLPESQRVMIRNIRSNHIDTLIVFDGIVRQSSDVRPQVVNAKFECPACGNTINILQVDTKFKEPSRCSCGRKGRFRLLTKDLVDAQRLVVEEVPEELEGGDQPKRLSVFLKEDLVEPLMEKKTTPGSKIRVIGIVKEVPIHLRTGAQSIRYDLMVEANNIEPIEEAYSEIEISEEDVKEIKVLAKDPKVYEKLVSSITPSVYGHEKVKEALVLQLMGGVMKLKEDGTRTRGDMHILLVGDPGASKSTMLMYMSKAAPKARYVAGKSASGAGLTATIVRDEFLRGWALEAGAMVLANGGYAMIDELDKMDSEDRDALHEALEQQRISISKANIQATLRAETTVLAAANPKFGRFDPFEPIANQIDLPPTLINRFDLIFPIRDIPSAELDEKIASHILEIQQSPQKLKPVIPIELFKKYIAYAKQTCKPKLSDEAVEEIKRFYVQLRNIEGFGEDASRKPIPISARQLEALVRLAEGSAKTRLDNTVKRKDARRAIELLKHCLAQVGFDPETGMIDIDRISSGIPASTRNRIRAVRDIIRTFDDTGKKLIPITDIISEAETQGINEDQTREIIHRLKREGEIFEPKKDHIEKI